MESAGFDLLSRNQRGCLGCCDLANYYDDTAANGKCRTTQASIVWIILNPSG